MCYTGRIGQEGNVLQPRAFYIQSHAVILHHYKDMLNAWMSECLVFSGEPDNVLATMENDFTTCML
jgi:hypothetical protein